MRDFGLRYFGMANDRQGTACVCRDSHSVTHGAFGAMSFGNSTSLVEHVLATSTLIQVKFQNFLIRVDGTVDPCVASKYIVLRIRGVIVMAGRTSCAIEFAGRRHPHSLHGGPDEHLHHGHLGGGPRRPLNLHNFTNKNSNETSSFSCV